MVGHTACQRSITSILSFCASSVWTLYQDPRHLFWIPWWWSINQPIHHARLVKVWRGSPYVPRYRVIICFSPTYSPYRLHSFFWNFRRILQGFNRLNDYSLHLRTISAESLLLLNHEWLNHEISFFFLNSASPVRWTVHLLKPWETPASKTEKGKDGLSYWLSSLLHLILVHRLPSKLHIILPKFWSESTRDWLSFSLFSSFPQSYCFTAISPPKAY